MQNLVKITLKKYMKCSEKFKKFKRRKHFKYQKKIRF